jgi:Zn-dependent peptidase ImmA (M78 family)
MRRSQTYLDFLPLDNNTQFLRYLQDKLGPLTKGEPVLRWIETIGNYFYSKTGQTRQQVNLNDYFPLLKIIACRYRKDLEVNARLIVEELDFIIELRDYGSNNDHRRQRYLLAHELAHIIFFDIRRYPLREYNIFPPGSREIEFLCNRIARAILIPECILYDKIKKHPKPGDKEFSMDVIRKMCIAFKVPASVLLQRLIGDTRQWNCMVLRFKYFNNGDNCWRLKERYIPHRYWASIKGYIPHEDIKKSKDNPKRYPSAKGQLAKQLNSVYNLFINDQSNRQLFRQTTRTYSVEEISDHPIKSFLLTYFYPESQLNVHYSLTRDKYTGSQYLNICVPLNNAKNTHIEKVDS